MITIAHLITGLTTGGAEATLLKLVSRMDRRQFRNVVISLTNRGALGDRIEAEGVRVEALHLNPAIPNPIALLRLVRILRRLKPDVLQTWLYHADLAGLLVAKISGVPILAANIRCSAIDLANFGRMTGAIMKTLARFSAVPNAVIVNSQAGKAVHEQLGYRPRRWELIPNGFDLDMFRPSAVARTELRRELQLDESMQLIGAAGRFDPMKDYPMLLEAAAAVAGAHPGVHFVLAGSGVDASNRLLRDRIASLGLESRVQLLGVRKDMPRIMAALDLFVSSSSYGEGMQNTVGEAMASGISCVVTDVGDAALLVGQSGRVVPVRDATALAAAMKEMIALPASEREAMGGRARQRIAEHFSIAAATARYEDLYRELCGR